LVLVVAVIVRVAAQLVRDLHHLVRHQPQVRRHRRHLGLDQLQQRWRARGDSRTRAS
jgi:hypothetical protein